MTPKRTQLPWMRDVVVGSVLQAGSGDFRVVRHVSRYRDGDLRCVTFAIRRCSWTKRASTTVNYTDLRMRGFRLIPVAPRRLTTPEDKRLAEAITERALKRPYAMTCCEAGAMP